MRLWSIHPKHLDRAGLTAVWREALLAKKVLKGKTKGYRHHPQLTRFRGQKDPVRAINSYLFFIWKEARSRGYRFDGRKVGPRQKAKIPVTLGQLRFECALLAKKLARRDPSRRPKPEPHPLFRVVSGPVEEWEKQ